MSRRRRASSRRVSMREEEEEHQPLESRFDHPMPVEQPSVQGHVVSEFEFLQCTGDDFKPVDVAARRLIRSHVMKNYFQEKRTQANTLSSASSASTVNSRDKLKGRWRLDSSKQQEDSAQRRGSKNGTSSSPPKNSQQSAQDGSSSDAMELLSGHALESGRASSQIKALTQRSDLLERFQANRIDPFNCLPIQTGKRIDRLMSFYAAHFTINSIALNPTRTWYNWVMKDPGLFNGILCTVALYMHSHVGIPIVKEDILYHRGETMKIINQRLHNMAGVDASVLIGVIATILSFENLCGNYFTSRAHLEALRRLIEVVGGLEQFNHNDSLGRGVAWCEFHYAAAHRHASPHKFVPANLADFPEELLLEAARTSPSTLISLPVYGSTVYNIFRRVHRLGIAISIPWIPFVDRVAISNLLHETEYDMLLLSSQLGPDRTGTTEDEDLIAITDALVTAAQLFVFLAIRNMPVRARIVEIYLSRLQLALDRPNLTDIWQEHCSLETLLWTLFMTAAGASGRPERALILTEMRGVAAMVNVKDRNGVEQVLRNFAWADSFAEECSLTCGEIFRRRSAPTEVAEW